LASPLIRTALMVRDLARSRPFYEAVLGLHGVYLEADLTQTVSWKLLGLPPGTAVRALILKPESIDGRPAPDFGMVGLFELGTAAPPCPPVAGAVRFGEPILVYYVADLAAALRATQELGGSLLAGPETFEIPGGEVSEAIIRDPDGVAINLVQAPEASAWTTTQRA
jgi:catechol 2,3-dioxygenase-like lactoylglutathione lyase family enzyme